MAKFLITPRFVSQDNHLITRWYVYDEAADNHLLGIFETEQDAKDCMAELEDMISHKYGNNIDYDIDYPSDEEFWGDENGDVEAYEAALKEAHQEFDLILSAIDAEMKVNPLLAQLLAPRYPFDPILGPNGVDDSGWDEPLLV